MVTDNLSSNFLRDSALLAFQFGKKINDNKSDCPFCHTVDSIFQHQNESEEWFFKCRKCGVAGDVADVVAHKQECSREQAITALISDPGAFKIKDANDAASRLSPDDFKALTRRLTEKAHSPEGIREQRKAVDKVLGIRRNDFSDLLNYNTEHDLNALFENRWLCRGGSCILTGPSGVGKSSLTMQGAALFSLGMDLFGIRPVKPLRSIVIQAENDTGDLAEMARGVVNGLDLSSRVDELEKNLSFINDCTNTGDKFISYLKDIVRLDRPDLIWVDPLFAFIGGNISDQELVSKFLRNGINPILQEFGCVVIFIHHTNKPPKDPSAKNAMRGSDFSYAGAGSAELTNWARATMVLRDTGGAFELRAAKRGKRAGLMDSSGQNTDHVCIQHGAKGICWERSESAENEENKAVDSSVSEVLSEMQIGNQYSRTDFRKIVENVTGKKKSQILKTGTIYNKIYTKALKLTSNPQFPGKFRAPISAVPMCSDSSKTERENTPISAVPLSPMGEPERRKGVEEIELLQLVALFDNDWKSKQTIIDLLKPTFKNRSRQVFEVFHSRHELHDVDKEAGEVKKPGFIVRMQSGSLMFKATKE